jgi:uroporphyrin-III C-methyltransferase
MKGKVFLVGAGPGDPELLTVKALRLLRCADVVLHDDLVSPEVLELIPAPAEVLRVGKRCGKKWVTQEEIHALMIGYAREGRTVVRLKGGDPAIFGRTGEEIEALREAAVDFEMVPGVTAASAAAAAAGIPLTDRRHASAVLLTTGHRSSVHVADDAGPQAQPFKTTVAVYMPGQDLRRVREELVQKGFDPSTPCLLVSQAASPRAAIHACTLGALEQSPPLSSPRLLIAGAVAASGQPAAAREEAGHETLPEENDVSLSVIA